MHMSTELAVANGAAWLDKRYPGWVDVIQVATLNLGDCSACVLGQVWSGCVPEGEREHILTQVAAALGDSSAAYYLRRGVAEDQGYQILVVHDLNVITDGHFDPMVELGFVTSACTVDCPDECSDDSYDQLTDEWTRMIIHRRLASHGNARTENPVSARLEWDLVAV